MNEQPRSLSPSKGLPNYTLSLIKRISTAFNERLITSMRRFTSFAFHQMPPTAQALQLPDTSLSILNKAYRRLFP